MNLKVHYEHCLTVIELLIINWWIIIHSDDILKENILLEQRAQVAMDLIKKNYNFFMHATHIQQSTCSTVM